MAAAPPLTEGERWSRELLAALRAARYRPAAWARFVASSLRRSGEARRARPALARQARRWGVGGAAATVVLARALRRRARGALAWWSLCWAMLEWHLGMVEGPRGERRSRLSVADALTLARLGLVPFALAPAGRGSWSAIVALGAACDGADGRLARRAGTTRLGAQLDSGADVLFFGAAAAGAARARWLPWPVALAAGARHLGGAGYVAWRWLARGSPPPLAPAGTRWAAGPAAAGLVLSAAGARRSAAALVAGSSAAALAARAVELAPASGEASAAATWDRLAAGYGAQQRLEAAAIGAALRLAAAGPGERLVDLGTGSGLLLRDAAAGATRPGEAVGVDRSAGMLARAPRLPAGWSLVRADARAVPLPDGWADAVTCAYVLHLLDADERGQLLAEAHRLLTAGGRLVVVTPWADRRRAGGRLLSAALDAGARLWPGVCGGLRPLDPTADLTAAGFALTRRVVLPRGGYPSLVLAARPAGAAAAALSSRRGRRR